MDPPPEDGPNAQVLVLFVESFLSPVDAFIFMSCVKEDDVFSVWAAVGLLPKPNPGKAPILFVVDEVPLPHILLPLVVSRSRVPKEVSGSCKGWSEWWMCPCPSNGRDVFNMDDTILSSWLLFDPPRTFGINEAVPVIERPGIVVLVGADADAALFIPILGIAGNELEDSI